MAAFPAPTTKERIAPLIAIAGFSGFAGLGYEIVWTRLLANSFGHEIVAVLGVLAALFGGLALGSFCFGRRIATASQPALWYAGLELAIGAWALVLVPLLPAIGRLVPALIPIDASGLRQWTAAFAVPSIVLLPATLAMGATLPALEALLAPRLRDKRAVGWAYAANTFGAVCGTLATTFFIMPALGLSRTLMVLAAVNLACALTMAGLARTVVTPGSNPLPAVRPDGRRARLAALFLTGLLGIGYEVAAVRTLSQVLENTVYTFAALLSVYLLGTAIGAVLHARLTAFTQRENASAWLATAACLCCVCGTFALGHVDDVQAALRFLPHSVGWAIAGELAIAAAIFLLPTIAMGALFTQLAQDSRTRDGDLAFALAANTAGAALAPLLFGPLLFPLLGAKLVLVLIAGGYVFVMPRARWAELMPRAVAAGIAAMLLVSSLSLRFVQIPPGGAVLWHRDGIMASVSVVEDRAKDRHLEINNHFRMGGTASIRSDYREADIPLLLHAGPKRALFLGLGTGATLSGAADHPGLIIDGVELVPEVPDSFALFTKAAPNIAGNPNIHIHTADARRFARSAAGRYDVVVADVYHPWIDGAGTLYTREHFAAIRALLAEQGLFCQWLPLHQLDLPTLQVIVRTFLAEFPHASAYLAQFSIGTPLIGLVARAETKYSDGWFKRRIADDRLRSRLAAVDLANDMALPGLFLADAAQLADFAGDGLLNTDDRQIVTFSAPRMAYVQSESPGERLLALLSALHPRAADVLASGDSAMAQRLADYWYARDRFLELGVRTAESTTIRDVIAEVAPKLIDIVRISADFDAAYRPVLAMAEQLARTDPEAARRLLLELDQANPSRHEARRQLVALPSD